MIKVTVHTIGLLRSLIRQGDLVLSLGEGSAVADLLVHLSDTYGSQVAALMAAPVSPDAHPPLRIMVNGRDIEVLDDRSTILADGDDVLVLTPMAGG